MQQRLDDADARKKATGEYRPEGDEAARKKARQSYQSEREAQLKDQFMDDGLTAKDAGREAVNQTAQEMARQDAAHNLDAIAGGTESDGLGMGNRSINRAIGAQWKSRIKALKNAVKRAKARGDKKMNVKLESCDDEPTS